MTNRSDLPCSSLVVSEIPKSGKNRVMSAWAHTARLLESPHAVSEAKTQRALTPPATRRNLRAAASPPPGETLSVSLPCELLMMASRIPELCRSFWNSASASVHKPAEKSSHLRIPRLSFIPCVVAADLTHPLMQRLLNCAESQCVTQGGATGNRGVCFV